MHTKMVWVRMRPVELMAFTATLILAGCNKSDIGDTNDAADVASFDELGDATPVGDIDDLHNQPDALLTDTLPTDALQSDVPPDVSPPRDTVPPDAPDSDTQPDTHESDADALPFDTEQPDTLSDVADDAPDAQEDVALADVESDGSDVEAGGLDADAGDVVDADVIERGPSSCTTVIETGDGVQRIEAAANADGRYTMVRLSIDGELRTEVEWEYDEFGRHTLRRERLLDVDSGEQTIFELQREWTEAPPSLAGRGRVTNDDNGEDPLNELQEQVYDSSGQTLELRSYQTGALTSELRNLAIGGNGYGVYSDPDGTGTSTVTYELVGTLPTPSRLLIQSGGVTNQIDFTWDSSGRIIEVREDQGADGATDVLTVLNYPTAQMTEETVYYGENPVAWSFTRRILQDGTLRSEQVLIPDGCFFGIDNYAVDGEPTGSRNGQYESASSVDCLRERRDFPESNYLSVEVSMLSRCGTTLEAADENGDGDYEYLLEQEWDAECHLLSQYIKDGTPGFETRTLTIEGIPTYNAEGWLTRLVTTSFFDSLNSDLVQTWDDRGNLMSSTFTEYVDETISYQIVRSQTWDAGNRRLTANETYLYPDTEPAIIFNKRYTYVGEWPESSCLDEIPTE